MFFGEITWLSQITISFLKHIHIQSYPFRHDSLNLLEIYLIPTCTKYTPFSSHKFNTSHSQLLLIVFQHWAPLGRNIHRRMRVMWTLPPFGRNIKSIMKCLTKSWLYTPDFNYNLHFATGAPDSPSHPPSHNTHSLVKDRSISKKVGYRDASWMNPFVFSCSILLGRRQLRSYYYYYYNYLLSSSSSSNCYVNEVRHYHYITWQIPRFFVLHESSWTFENLPVE